MLKQKTFPQLRYSNSMSLKKCGNLLKETMAKLYPNLMLEDLRDYWRTIEDEYIFLLSSCLDKSIDRVLLRSNMSPQGYVIFERNGGFSKPLVKTIRIGSGGVFLDKESKKFRRVEGDTALRLGNIGRVDDDGTLWISVNGLDFDSPTKYIKTDELKKASAPVNQNRLQIFYKAIKESGELAKRLRSLYPLCDFPYFPTKEKVDGHYLYHYVGGGVEFKVEIGPNAWIKIEVNGSYWGVFHHSLFCSNYEAKKVFQIIFEKFHLFDEALSRVEEKRAEIVEMAKKLLKQLREYNKPIRILEKLMENE